MTGRHDIERTVSKSTLLSAGQRQFDAEQHDFSPDPAGLSCLDCGTKPENRRHWTGVRAFVAILNPDAPTSRIPAAYVVAQIELPLPRAGTT